MSNQLSSGGQLPSQGVQGITPDGQVPGYGQVMNPGEYRNNGKLIPHSQAWNTSTPSNLPEWMNGIYQNTTPWAANPTDMSNTPGDSSFAQAGRPGGFGSVNNDVFHQGFGYQGSNQGLSPLRQNTNLNFGVNSVIPTQLTQLNRYLTQQEAMMAQQGRPVDPNQPNIDILTRNVL